MRCDCCDAELNDSESTARFKESGNYVNMCADCRGFLPKNIKVITRPDLERAPKEPHDRPVSEDPPIMDWSEWDGS